MSNNPYAEYYRNQAGSGLTKYEGIQYQRGHGFFGTLFSSIIKPLVKYLGRKALETGVSLGSDVMKGQNFKESLKSNLKRTGEVMIDDGAKRAKKYVQTGNGKRKKRRRNVNSVKRKTNKRKKSKVKKPLKKKLTKRSNRKRLKKIKKQKKIDFSDLL